MSSSLPSSASRFLLLTIVLISGGTVMVLEVLGARFFAPYFGTSIDVLTGILTTVLGGLTLGYTFGGSIADTSGKNLLILSFAFACASLFGLIISASSPLLQTISITVDNPAMGSLLASLIVFGPINVILGVVSPIAVKIMHDLTGDMGRSTGSVYALSTTGSITGTILAGFVLIPHMGIHVLFLGCTAVLLTNALLCLLLHVLWGATIRR